MKIIWIRHGETEANVRGVYLGHSDSPLTAKGRLQAEETANRLGGKHLVRMYTSDLGRCLETAAIIGEKIGIDPIKAAELRELDFGSWDGLDYETVMGLDREQAQAWYENPLEVSPPEGETLRELGSRVDRWLAKELAQSAADDAIAVITHGGPLRWFLSRHVSGEVRDFWRVQSVEPGALLAAYYDGASWRLIAAEKL